MRIAEGTYNHYEDIVEIGKEGFGTVRRAASRLTGKVVLPLRTD
jgi:hypothetical protein